MYTIEGSSESDHFLPLAHLHNNSSMLCRLTPHLAHQRAPSLRCDNLQRRVQAYTHSSLLKPLLHQGSQPKMILNVLKRVLAFQENMIFNDISPFFKQICIHILCLGIGAGSISIPFDMIRHKPCVIDLCMRCLQHF